MRLGALYTGMTFAEVTANMRQVYESMSREIGENIGITILPAGVLSIEDYVDYILSTNYRIAILD